MNTNTMKLLGIALVNAPADTENGGGGGDIDENREGEGEGEGEDEDEGEEDEDEETDPDDDTDEDDETDTDDETDADEESEEEEDKELGKRAQKRIAKLTAERKDAQARVKALETQLEQAKKLSGDDGKAIIKAAEASGILPGLMTKDEAEAFSVIEQYPKVISNYQDWLDEHDREDTFGSGNHEMSYGEVKKRVRQLKEALDDARSEFGDRRKELRKKVREIFEAGLAALKEGGKAAKPKAKGKDKGGDEGKRKGKKTLDKPKAGGPRHKHSERDEDLENMEVDSPEDLENFIAATMRKKKK